MVKRYFFRQAKEAYTKEMFESKEGQKVFGFKTLTERAANQNKPNNGEQNYRKQKLQMREITQASGLFQELKTS
jgi:hypothetical protein